MTTPGQPTDSAAPKTCRQCGQPLGGLAPSGICPRCLLTGALDEPTVAASAQPDTLPAAFAPRNFGDYVLLDEIARGGMGIVYRARQTSLDRHVAVKMLLFGQYSSDEFIHRFRIEAAAAASLQHPNIVAIHEVGVHQGQHYFAMDLVEGPDLSRLVRDRPLPARQAARYVQIIAAAIHFAHQRRILHRDIKPSNILIDSATDQPRVTDFGLAKRLSPETPGTGSQLSDSLTVTGQVLGSPSYMPPEQASARRGQLGPASDVYSLGAVLYFALTGRAPFLGQNIADTLEQVLNKEPVSPRLLAPGIPADLETICLKCLEKEPAARYSSAQELAQELDRFIRDEPIHACPITRAERAWRWCRRKPALAASLTLSLLLLLTVVIGSPITALHIRLERDNAQAEALRAFREKYAADMMLAQQALAENNLGHALDLLESHRPKKSQQPTLNVSRSVDLRGFEWHYLWNQCQSDELCTLTGHSNIVASVRYSPDGRWLASASWDGTLRLWDTVTRQEATNFVHPDALYSAVFSPDGKILASATDYEAVIRFWELPLFAPCLR
ncbi:MAG: hypothetical protein EXS31_18640 [Pedosphaera sp.]|nr:hypothetical protein [Pedosphaera sp.]